MKRSILVWELTGIIAIITAGSLLHFVFNWMGQWKPSAIIAAVNESVWEHLKIGFWPALFFSLIEYKYIKGITNNFWIAKSIGIYLIPITIIVLFYSYTAILGRHILVIDILIFAAAITVGQMTSWFLLTFRPLDSRLEKIAIGGLVILIILFSLLSFFPPRLDLFKDKGKNLYGIP